MIRPLKVGHLVLKVPNLEQAEKFYTQILGFDVVNRLDQPPAVFLTLGVQHHDLALFQIAGTIASSHELQAGMHHFALQLADDAALRSAHAHLKRHGVAILRAVDHGTTHSVYFHDPAGNRVELYCDIGEYGLERARKRTVRDVKDFPQLDLG